MVSSIDLSGKTAIVTGSSRGIGYVIASRLAEQGASVIINGVPDNDIAAKAHELSRKHSQKVIAVVADVSTAAGALALVKAAHSHFRRPDIMVNNTGIMRGALIGMFRSEDIDETLHVNIRGVINGT